MTLEMLYRLQETIAHYYIEREDFFPEEIRDLNSQLEALHKEMGRFSEADNDREWVKSSERFEKVTGRRSA